MLLFLFRRKSEMMVDCRPVGSSKYDGLDLLIEFCSRIDASSQLPWGPILWLLR